MANDSTGTQAPWFGPGFPSYPHIDQLARVSAGALGGSSVYPGFMSQLKTVTPQPALRDRESVYIWAVNGEQLSINYYYLCRLVGSYLGLPLLATYCCQQGLGGSSSSSASPFPGPIQRTSLGTAQTNSGTSVTLSGITAIPGSLLIVVASMVGTANGQMSCTFGGTDLNQDNFVGLPSGSPLKGDLFLFSGFVFGTADIVASILFGGVAQALTLQAIQVTGLSNGLELTLPANGLASAPVVGTLSPSVSAPRYTQGGFVLVTPTFAWTWANSFTSGGQDLAEVISGTAVDVTEGYRITAGTTPVNAALGGIAPVAWCGLEGTYT